MFHDSKAFSSFSTDDIAAAKTFYKDTLGLDVEEMPEGLSLRLAFGGNVFIYPKPDHEAATFTVLNFDVDDIDTTVDALTAKGVEMQHYDMPEMKTDEKGIVRNPSEHGPGPRAMGWFKDPAGNIIGVMQEK